MPSQEALKRQPGHYYSDLYKDWQMIFANIPIVSPLGPTGPGKGFPRSFSMSKKIQKLQSFKPIPILQNSIKE